MLVPSIMLGLSFKSYFYRIVSIGYGELYYALVYIIIMLSAILDSKIF